MALEWSDLPLCIWILILSKLPIADFLRCAAVCCSWRSIVRHEKRLNPSPQIPWLILSSRGAADLTLFDPAAGKVRTIHLPELLKDATIIGISKGWLTVVGNADLELRSFNPITRAQIRLPPTATLPGFAGVERDSRGRTIGYIVERRGGGTRAMTPSYFGKVVLKWNDSSSSESYTAVVIYDYGEKLAFARDGDGSWMEVARHNAPICKGWSFSDGLFHRELFYAIYLSGVVAFDISSSNNGGGKATVVSGLDLPDRIGVLYSYLVEMPENGDLLEVRRYSSLGMLSLGLPRFKVLRLDPEELRWVEVRSLGSGRGLLLGDTFCVPLHESVALDLPGRGDSSIYFVEEHCVNVFDLEDGSIRPCFSDVPAASRCSQWIIPDI